MRALHSFSVVIVLGTSLFVSARVHGQVAPSAEGGPTETDDETMMTPPPVSGIPYGSTALSDVKTDFLTAGIVVTPAYIDNVLPNIAQAPVGNAVISIDPTVSINRTAPRHQEAVSYNPSLTIYEPTTALNSFDQSASGSFLYRFSPRLSLTAQDTFVKTSDVFDQPYVFSSPVNGSTLAATQTIISPFTSILMNTTTGVLSYQFAKNAMVGGGGMFEHFGVPNNALSAGLASSNESEVLAFYSRRLSRNQYFGLAYQYSDLAEYPAKEPTAVSHVNSLLPYYTQYFNRTFSISVSAGVSHVSASQPGFASSASWNPSVSVSGGWQFRRGSLAGGYSRSITTGGGLVGAFNTSSTSGSASIKLSRTWNAGAAVGYSSIDTATPLLSISTPSGNTFTAQGTLQYTIGEHLNMSFGYQRLNTHYENVPAESADPDSDREFVTVTYQFSRPLGR